MTNNPPARTSIAGNPSEVATEIDAFETSLNRFISGKIPEASFLEYRLRHGVYGQRQDGVHMIRSKLPLGLIGPDQLDAFADLTEAYSSGVAHLTTRQDIQVHFVPLTQTPDLMRVLAKAEMTSREACGNVVRNIVSSEVGGVEPGEGFDPTPYGMALSEALLRHPDGQSLGRKFKVSLAGSFDRRYNVGAFHDLGATAVLRNGERGFHVVVGGGLGAVPHEARVLSEFLSPEELLPHVVAILRLFAKHGEKKKRARARMKFLVASWGIERFRAEVFAERAQLGQFPEWTGMLRKHLDGRWTDVPLHGPGADVPQGRDDEERHWLATNVLSQSQPGYATVKIRVPRGDLSPTQLRALANLLREHTGDALRIGVDQSLYLRQVPTDRLLQIRAGLSALGLAQSNAGGLGDTVTCPGNDSCKLGITSPRSVARRMQPQLDKLALHPLLKDIKIKISGCPNSCAQHQVADIGFFGAAKTKNGVTAPHYVLLLGGRAGGTDGVTFGGGFGVSITKIPAARVGTAVERLTALYLAEAAADELWGAFAKRLGRARFQGLLADLTELPSPEEAPELFREHGKQTETFKVVRGTGECAGAVVMAGDLLMVDADRDADTAVGLLADDGDVTSIRNVAFNAMKTAAKALLTTEGISDTDDPVGQFKSLFYDAGRIYEGVGHYLLQAEAEVDQAIDSDRLRRLVVESGLFVEEAHTILGRLQNPAPKPNVTLAVAK